MHHSGRTPSLHWYDGIQQPIRDSIHANYKTSPKFWACYWKNAAAVVHARHNGDFHRGSEYYEGMVAFHKLSDEMRESLLRFSICLDPTVKQGERCAVERQREAKWMRKEVLRKKKLLAAKKEYSSALTYIKMYHSQAF